MVDGWTVLMMKTEVQMQKTPVVNWWCLVRYPNPNWLSSQLENLTRWCLTWNKYHSHSPEWCHLSSRRQPHTWKASFCNEIHPHRQVGKRQIQQNSTYCPGLDLQCPGCGSLEGPDIFVITNVEQIMLSINMPFIENFDNFVAKPRVFTCWPASSEKERSVSDIHLKEENCEKGWGGKVRRKKKRERIGNV